MVSRKGYGGDANVSVVKRNKNGLNGQKNKGEGRERGGWRQEKRSSNAEAVAQCGKWHYYLSFTHFFSP